MKTKKILTILITIISVCYSQVVQSDTKINHHKNGGVDALNLTDESGELMLIQMDLASDSLLLLIKQFMPDLALSSGNCSYQRVVNREIYKKLETKIPEHINIIAAPFRLETNQPNRESWSYTYSGSNYRAAWSSYGVCCMNDENYNYCITLGDDDCPDGGFWGLDENYGGADWEFNPPIGQSDYQYIDHIKIRVYGVECDPAGDPMLTLRKGGEEWGWLDSDVWIELPENDGGESWSQWYYMPNSVFSVCWPNDNLMPIIIADEGILDGTVYQVKYVQLEIIYSLPVPPDLDVTGSCPDPFQYNGGTCEVRVYNDGGGTLHWGSSVSSGDSGWLHRSPTSGYVSAGDYDNVTITVDYNSGSDRYGDINFYNYDDTGDDEDRDIHQEGPECEFTYDESIPNLVPVGGGNYSVTLNNEGETEINWDIVTSCNWITCSPDEGTIQPGSSMNVTISIDENTSPGDRTCNIEIDSNCGDFSIPVTQEGPDNNYTCGNLKITGNSISGSGSQYTISENVQIGHISGDYLIVFPNGVFSINTSGNGSITPVSGYSTFHSTHSSSIAFEYVSGLSFNCSSGSATFSGEFLISNDLAIQINNEVLYFDTETLEISAQDFIDQGNYIPDFFPDFTATIDLSNTTFTFGFGMGECIDFWDILAIDTRSEISWSFDIKDVAIGINVDLNFLEIGKVGDDCIDRDGFVFSPLPNGPQIHVEWDVDDKILTFTDNTSISIPLSVVRDQLTNEQIAELYEQGKIIETRDGRSYVTLGITVYSGSYIDFGNGSFNLDCGIDVDVAGSSVGLDPISIGYDGACEFYGNLEMGGNLFSNWVDVTAGMGFNFDDCDRDYCLNGSFGLDLWLAYLDLDAQMCFHYADDPWINGVLQAYLNILGWSLSSGAEFQLSSDYLIINGHMFDLPGRTMTRIDSLEYQWTIDKSNQRITGNILDSLDISHLGFSEIPEGQFVFDPVSFSLNENDSTLFFENSYKAISMNWKLSNRKELVVSNRDYEKISISVPSYIDVLRLIYLEDSTFAEVNDSSHFWTMPFFSGDQGDDGDNKYIHLYFDNTPTSAFSVQIENGDSREMLDFISFQSGLLGRGISKLVDYSNSNIEMNTVYEVLLDGNVNNISGGSESIGPEWSLNFYSEGGEFVFQNISAGWNESFDTLAVSLSTSLPSECWLIYGESDTSATDTLWDTALSNTHEFNLMDVFSDWKYQVFAVDEENNLIISSWKTVPPRGIPVASFSADSYYGCAPFEVQFIDETDQGAGELISYLWDFGDGQMSGEIEPFHIYEEPGVYTVSLRVTTTFGEDVEICVDCIQIEKLDAGFIANPTEGDSPLTVLFADTSIINGENPVWSWDFDGDGYENTNEQGPHSFTYNIKGIYYPKLTLTTSCGMDSTVFSFICVDTTVSIYNLNDFPHQYRLYQNIPNPFNAITIISYQLPKMGIVQLEVYDLQGQLVETLINEQKAPGSYSVTWNADDVSSGLYFYKLSTGNQTIIKKMLLMK